LGEGRLREPYPVWERGNEKRTSKGRRLKKVQTKA